MITFLNFWEEGIVVVLDFAEFEEVEAGVGSFGGKEIDDYISEGSF